MLAESTSTIPSSIWASITSWLTPTVLFLLLNLMIAIIALISKPTSKDQHQNQPSISRSPSLLHRLKSINFYPHYKSQEFSQEVSQKAPNLFDESLQRTQTQLDDFQPAFEDKRVEESEPMSMDEVYGMVTGSRFIRTESDTEPASGNMPAKLPAGLRKSASSKSAFGHFEEAEITEARRPATVRERGNAKVTDGDEEVDAKADDFISKFKQQLKLQRLDSILRYKK